MTSPPDSPADYALAPQVAGWAPSPVTRVERLDPRPLDALAATLGMDAPDPGTVPPLWHWLYFLDWPPAAELGEDGHPAAGHFLPPLRQRTRMFAGGRLEQRRPLETGIETQRVSTIVRTEVKQGRSGELLFVVLRHEFRQRGELYVVEEQDVVYRSGPQPGRTPAAAAAAAKAPRNPVGSAFRPSATTLFRFSALTGNAHRIHYDADYARGVEGYDRLVIHGPLQILLMLRAGAARAPGALVAGAQYRLLSPALLGDELDVAAEPEDGGVAVKVYATGRATAGATARLTFH